MTALLRHAGGLLPALARGPRAEAWLALAAVHVRTSASDEDPGQYLPVWTTPARSPAAWCSPAGRHTPPRPTTAPPLPLTRAARLLHSSAAPPALGVVDLLRDDVAVALPTGAQRSFWEVLEFRPDASVLETWKTPEVLGLHPRDVHLFASDSGMGQRAMIAARSNAILFRTEVAKAVIYADRAVLFPARRQQDTVKVAQAVKSAVSQRSALPFELKVLESLLAETARAFDTKGKRLGMVAETVMDDINKNFHASAAELQRLLPVNRKLSEVQHDVKDTLDAIGDVANYDDQLQAICLTGACDVAHPLTFCNVLPCLEVA